MVFVKYLVVGAGPAGLQMGYYLREHDYMILEANSSSGSFFKTHPRHRTLISINKVYTGYDDPELKLRWDWNSLLTDKDEMCFSDYSHEYFPHADHMVAYLEDFAQYFSLNIQFNSPVLSVEKTDEGYLVKTPEQEYTCSYLLWAAGMFTPYTPDIPGIEHAEPYTTMSTNPTDFTNQKVLIIGKGNSAFESANHLLGTTASIHLISPKPVTLAAHSRYVGHLRSINQIFLDSYHLKSQNVIHNADVAKLERLSNGKIAAHIHYHMAEEETETLVFDTVLNCTGFQFDDSVFKTQPEKTACGRFPKMSPVWESTNLKNLYFMGVLMHGLDYKKKQSGFIHGFRYNIEFLSRHLLNQNGEAHPFVAGQASVSQLSEHILNRLNRSSALWQQTGFLSDICLIHEGQYQYYEAWPTDFRHDILEGFGLTISLEFGPLSPEQNPLALERPHRLNTASAAKSQFIHPVIRFYNQQHLLKEHHIIEDLQGEWREPEHIAPLNRFLEHCLNVVYPMESTG